MVMVPVSSGAGPSSVLRVCTSRAGGVSSGSGRLRSQMPCGMTEERNGDCLACVAYKGRAGAGSLPRSSVEAPAATPFLCRASICWRSSADSSS